MPSTYWIKPDDETLVATMEEEIKYNISCDPKSAGYAQCIINLYNGLDPTTLKKWITFRIDGVDTQIEMTCLSATDTASLKNCSITLPTGKKLEFLVGIDL